jgi:cytochrome c oxidase subunit 3
VYGALFYTLIGAHGVHVLGALLALSVVLARATAGRYSRRASRGVELCWIYWCFVVGVWPVLYVLVYLV